jgi:DNA-binding NarL/FixJ family response regulator
VLLVDAHPASREGLAARLAVEQDFEVCGEAADMAAALTQVAATGPDVIVVDLVLRRGDGLELIKRLKDRECPAKILTWSRYCETVYAERALRAGAAGYIGKEEATAAVIAALRQVLAGGVYLNPRMMNLVVQRNVAGLDRDVTPDSLGDLSDRELDVFRLTGPALDTAQVAERLKVSPKTVETYKARIKEKLGLDSGGEMLYRAIRWVIEDTYRPAEPA